MSLILLLSTLFLINSISGNEGEDDDENEGEGEGEGDDKNRYSPNVNLTNDDEVNTILRRIVSESDLL